MLADFTLKICFTAMNILPVLLQVILLLELFTTDIAFKRVSLVQVHLLMLGQINFTSKALVTGLAHKKRAITFQLLETGMSAFMAL